MMFDQSLDTLTADSIKQLLSNAVPEGQHLDYKQLLPDPRDDKKKTDFLIDVVSFANGGGGDLVFGVTEDKGTGTPGSIDGLAGFAGADAEFRRLQQMVDVGVDPRVVLQSKAIEGFPKGPVFILRVPRSWNGPHMVTKDGGTRFYVRRANGNVAMVRSEIQSAFLGAEEVPQRIRRLRDERLARIVARETPAPMEGGAFYALHVVPLQATQRGSVVDVVSLKERNWMPRPIQASGWFTRFNLDGVVSVAGGDGSSSSYAYTQVFRNGVVEAVAIDICGNDERHGRIFYPEVVENGVLQILPIIFRMYREIKVDPPLVILLSVFGVGGAKIHAPRFHGSRPIDRDALLLPDVLVDSLDATPSALMRDTFDVMWQSGGFARSPGYGENGGRKPDA